MYSILYFLIQIIFSRRCSFLFTSDAFNNNNRVQEIWRKVFFYQIKENNILCHLMQAYLD